jgi:anti-sigma B factor antagonist
MTSPANVRTIVLEGKLRMGDAVDGLRSQMEIAIHSGTPNLVLDFSRVTGVDSSAIGVLVRGLTIAQSAGGGIRLAAVSAHVMNSLRLTALLQLFSIYPSVETAVESFTSHPPQAC